MCRSRYKNGPSSFRCSSEIQAQNWDRNCESGSAKTPPPGPRALHSVSASYQARDFPSPDTLRPPISTPPRMSARILQFLMGWLPSQDAPYAVVSHSLICAFLFALSGRGRPTLQATQLGNGRILHNQADTGLMSSHRSVPRASNPLLAPKLQRIRETSAVMDESIYTARLKAEYYF